MSLRLLSGRPFLSGLTVIPDILEISSLQNVDGTFKRTCWRADFY